MNQIDFKTGDKAETMGGYIRQGMVVEIVENMGDLQKVRFGDGETGMLKTINLKPLNPSIAKQKDN